MLTARMAKKLGLKTENRVLVVQSFMHTQTMDSEFTVLEILKEDGSVEQIKAYEVEDITTVPENLANMVTSTRGSLQNKKLHRSSSIDLVASPQEDRGNLAKSPGAVRQT